MLGDHSMAYNTTRPHDPLSRPYNGHQYSQYAPPSQQFGQERYYNGTGNQDWAYGGQDRYDERPQYQDQQYEKPHGDLNKGPRHLEQQRYNYTESPGHGGSYYQAPPQFGKYPPQSSYQEPPMSGPLPLSDYPARNCYNVAQRPESQQHPQYSGQHAYYKGPHEAAGAYSRQDGYRGPGERQLQLQGPYHNEAGYVDNRNQRPALDIPDPKGMKRSHERTPQVTAHGYVSNDSSGNTSRANVGTPLYPTQSPVVKKVQPIKPAKERILGGNSFPETLSWDNPFPTFPLNKRKATHSEAESLHGGLAVMNLKGDGPPCEGSPDTRPETASSKSSHASSRGYERHNEGTLQGFRNGMRPNPSGTSNLVNTQQYDPSQYHQNTQSLGIESRNIQPSGAEWHNAGDARSFIPPVQNSRPCHQNQGFDHTPTQPSFPAKVAFNPGQQRSRAMPNRLAETYPSSAPQSGLYSQPSWSEPDPTTAGYRSPERGAYLPNAPVRSSDLTPVVPPGPNFTEYIPSHTYGNHQSARPSQRPPHSKQESYGNFFDSYNDTPQHNQMTHTQSGGSHHQYGIGEGVQDFSAMPDEPSRQKQGMTSERNFRTQVQQRATGAPPMPASFYNGNAKVSYQHPDFAAQAHRSRSQPDLRQYHQPKDIGNSGFNFELDGEVRNVASVPPRVNQFGPQSSSHSDPRYNRTQLENPASSHHNQHQDLPARIKNDEVTLTVPPHDNMARFPDARVRENSQANDHHHTGSQNNGQPLQDMLPGFPKQKPRDDVRSVPGQGRGPVNVPSPISRTGPTSPPVGPPSNPDALPPHPAPVRPGLMQAYMVNQNTKPLPVREHDGGSSSVQPMPGPLSHQAPKPIPVRQYNGGPTSLQQAGVAQPTVPPMSSRDGGTLAVVTQEEIERLKQAVKANPSDQKTQLILAKKMVEAAAILVDEGGRADLKTKNKNREKYIFDAHKLVKKLVHGGYPEAMFYLADCHGRGLLGLEPDTKEAFNLYQSAAKAGHAQSAYRVAVCCEMGQEEGGGTRRDPLKSIQWYKRAATLGDTPAMYKMGMIQLKGLLGQPKNPREAIGWLKRAAERADEENPHALHELGLLYETASGNDNIIRDEAYSKQLFTQAADLGYKFSQYRLGCAYEYGLMGCPIDPRQSIAWYSRAAVQEEHQSELALSGWYLTGSEGVLQQSDTEAYLWARKAGQAGLAKAEYAMGYFTEVGIGAPANIDDAKRWYWRAASQNFPKARERLEDLRKGGAKMQKSKTISRSAVDRRSDGECNIM